MDILNEICEQPGFIGCEESKIDNKKRVVLPVVFRDLLGPEPVLNLAPGHNEFPSKNFGLSQESAVDLSGLIFASREDLRAFWKRANLDLQQAQMIVLERLSLINCEESGRFIPADEILREGTKTLKFVGAGSHIQVFSAAA